MGPAPVAPARPPPQRASPRPDRRARAPHRGRRAAPPRSARDCPPRPRSRSPSHRARSRSQPSRAARARKASITLTAVAVQHPRADRPERGPGARATRAHDQPAVRAHAADDRLRPPLGARRGRVPLRRRGQPLPRHARRLRHVQRRAQRTRGCARRSHEGLDLELPGRVALGVTQPAGLLAEALLERAPSSLGRVLFTSSGTESVEAAIKLGRAATGRSPRRLRRARLPRADARRALRERRPAFTERFQPLLPGFSHVPFNDLDALEAELRREDVAMFITEPIVGHGVRLPDAGLPARARRRSAAATGRSSASTRWRRASAAPGACSRASTGGSSRT